MDDTWLKVLAGFFTTSLGWAWAWGRNNNKKHDKHSDHICELQRKSAVAEEQMKHVLVKLDDVLKLGDDIKKSNRTILNALARKAKNSQ